MAEKNPPEPSTALSDVTVISVTLSDLPRVPGRPLRNYRDWTPEQPDKPTGQIDTS